MLIFIILCVFMLGFPSVKLDLYSIRGRRITCIWWVLVWFCGGSCHHLSENVRPITVITIKDSKYFRSIKSKQFLMQGMDIVSNMLKVLMTTGCRMVLFVTWLQVVSSFVIADSLHLYVYALCTSSVLHCGSTVWGSLMMDSILNIVINMCVRCWCVVSYTDDLVAPQSHLNQILTVQLND